MSRRMIPLDIVEAWTGMLSGRRLNIDQLREMAVDVPDAHETAVILPAGWDVRRFHVEVNGCTYDVHRILGQHQNVETERLSDYAHLAVDAPDLQSAVNALARVLEGEVR